MRCSFVLHGVAWCYTVFAQKYFGARRAEAIWSRFRALRCRVEIPQEAFLVNSTPDQRDSCCPWLLFSTKEWFRLTCPASRSRHNRQSQRADHICGLPDYTYHVTLVRRTHVLRSSCRHTPEVDITGVLTPAFARPSHRAEMQQCAPGAKFHPSTGHTRERHHGRSRSANRKLCGFG